jgi:hypothetical protein
MDYSEVPIIKKSYELYGLLHSCSKGIDKFERYSLWQNATKTNLVILEKLLLVGHSEISIRMSILKDVSVKLDLLKVYIRLAFDIKIIDKKIYINIQKHLEEIGRMLGGWIKAVSLPKITK